MNPLHCQLRPLQKSDFSDLDKQFGGQTIYKKSFSLWHDYLSFQEQNTRVIRVAEFQQRIVGICTLKWRSEYLYFSEQNIPEINDLLVAPHYRNQGIGRMLITVLEKVMIVFLPCAS